MSKRIILVGITPGGFEKQLANCDLKDMEFWSQDTPGVTVDADGKKIVFDRSKLPEELERVEVRIDEW